MKNKHLILRAASLLLCGVFGVFCIPTRAYAAEYAGVSRDYSVTSVTVSEPKGRSFTVRAAFAYYGDSARYTYKEDGEFVTASPYTPRLVNQLKLWGATEHELDELYKNE